MAAMAETLQLLRPVVPAATAAPTPRAATVDLSMRRRRPGPAVEAACTAAMVPTTSSARAATTATAAPAATPQQRLLLEMAAMADRVMRAAMVARPQPRRQPGPAAAAGCSV